MQIQILSILLTVVFLGTAPTQLIAQEPDATTKAKIEQRDQLSQKAEELVKSGELDKAAEMFERVYLLEQTIFGDSHADLLGTLDMLRDVAEAKKDYDAIIGYCVRQQTITEKLYGADDYRTKDAAIAVTDAKLIVTLTPDEQRQLEQANELLTESIKAYDASYYAVGIKAVTECLAIRETVMGKQHPDYAESLNNLALLYRSMGDYEQSAAPESPATDNDARPLTPTTLTGPGPVLLASRGGQWQIFNDLPGTSAEIDTIESMLRKYRPTAKATILRGSSATEETFSQIAPSQRYLHVATHGFFAPETVKNALAASSSEPNRMFSSSDLRPSKPLGQHPDLLSGLVFAGANHEPVGGANDGILTAAEVHSLDLRGVDLAVLSACETGLGQSAGGKGIIGLQRAFQLAGVHTTITSLWQVDDAATRALMVEFYRNLFEKKLSKLESLRQAQIWMLNNPSVIEGRNLTTRGEVRETKANIVDTQTKPSSGRSLPAYWAAFQLSGDPR